MPIRAVLCIAGSDSSGASGIQADLKTLSALGVHGLSAITAVTAQNTLAIEATGILPAARVAAQLDAVAADFAIDAVKIGMLGSAASVRVVTRWIQRNHHCKIVLDPVLLSSSGKELLTPAGRNALIRHLLPNVDVLTPNAQEAAVMLGRKIRSADDMRLAASDLMRLGPRCVLLKGGHFVDGVNDHLVSDYFVDAAGVIRIDHPRLDFDARGTGCTLASALAANLALGFAPRAAMRRAERYLQGCLARAYSAGNANKRLLGHTLKFAAT